MAKRARVKRTVSVLIKKGMELTQNEKGDYLIAGHKNRRRIRFGPYLVPNGYPAEMVENNDRFYEVY